LACLPCMVPLRLTEARYLYVNCENLEECYQSAPVSSQFLIQTRLLPTLPHKKELCMSTGGRALEWPSTRTPHADILPARAGIGMMRQLFLPCVCRLLACGADAASRATWLPVWATPVARCPRRSMKLLGDARRNRQACWGVSNAQPM
jgi:hypothetical protein